MRNNYSIRCPLSGSAQIAPPGMGSASLDFVSAHAPGMAGIGYAGTNGELRIISCGQDGQLCKQSAEDLSNKVINSMQTEVVACHCLAVSPARDSFAVGDQAHFVKVCPFELHSAGYCAEPFLQQFTSTVPEGSQGFTQVHNIFIIALTDIQAS